jgi:hypothetical protein
MNKFFLCTLALTVCALTGCATSRPPTPSVALAGETRLAPWPCHNALITPTDDAVVRNYHAILIDPVSIPESSAGDSLSAEQRTALAARLDAALAKACAPFRPVTDRPGEGVLRLKATVSSVRVSKPALNALTTLLIFVPVDMGGAGVEFELIDSVSGQRLAAYVSDHGGSPFQVISALRKTGHAEAVFHCLSREFLDRTLGQPDPCAREERTARQPPCLGQTVAEAEGLRR